MHHNLDLIPPVNITPIADDKIESNKDTVVTSRRADTDVQDQPGPAWHPMPNARIYIHASKQIPYIQNVLKETEALANSVKFTVTSLALVRSESSECIDTVNAAVEMDKAVKSLNSFEYYVIQHLAESMVKDMVSRMDKDFLQIKTFNINLIGITE